MSYYINGKEVGYAEYIEYLENVILSVEKDLDEMSSCGLPCVHHGVDEAANTISLNKKMHEEMLKKV